MELKKQEHRYATTQYIIKDGKYEFAITEILFREDTFNVFIYNEDSFCVGEFCMSCCRGIYAWSGMVWCTQNEDDDFDEDALNLIAGEIIKAHNEDNEIIKEAMTMETEWN